jgi:hypothetical protein
MKFDILDYLGKLNDGVLVLIGLSYEDEYYDGTFYYTKEMLALTVDNTLEEKLGCQIEDWSGYRELMIEIIKRVVPYDEIIVRIDDFDPAPLLSGATEASTATDVDNNEVVSATQSL